MENNPLLDISRISGRRGSKKQDVLPCMRKKKNRWRCSFRSDGKWINVNELLQAFGGGGHAAAAGVRKRTNDVEKFRQEILERIVAMRKISGQDK